jgi:hypothetical protein
MLNFHDISLTSYARQDLKQLMPEGNRIDLMLNETIETSEHTTKDGILNLSIKVGAADADVAVIVQLRAVTPEDRVDTNGWSSDFFERVAGSMPDLQRPSQGNFEDRATFE